MPSNTPASRLTMLLLSCTLPLSQALPQKFNIKPMVPNVIRLDSTFTLVVNVTNPAHDFADFPVNGLALTGVRLSAFNNIATLTNTSAPSFFLTSTDTVRANGGTQPFPTGFTVYGPSEDASGEFQPSQYIGLDRGYGTAGVKLPVKPPVDFSECPALTGPGAAGTYVVCDSGFSAPQHPRLMVRWVAGTANVNDWYADEPNVPKECIAVKLLPQCVRDGKVESAAPLQEGETAVQALCWDNLKTVQWEKRSRC